LEKLLFANRLLPQHVFLIASTSLIVLAALFRVSFVLLSVCQITLL
jgi:hypothetical protein